MREEAFVALRACACGMESTRSIVVEWALLALFTLAFEIERTKLAPICLDCSFGRGRPVAAVAFPSFVAARA